MRHWVAIPIHWHVLYQANRLKKHGATSWDDAYGYEVKNISAAPLRTAVFGVAALIAFGISSIFYKKELDQYLKKEISSLEQKRDQAFDVTTATSYEQSSANQNPFNDPNFGKPKASDKLDWQNAKIIEPPDIEKDQSIRPVAAWVISQYPYYLTDKTQIYDHSARVWWGYYQRHTMASDQALKQAAIDVDGYRKNGQVCYPFEIDGITDQHQVRCTDAPDKPSILDGIAPEKKLLTDAEAVGAQIYKCQGKSGVIYSQTPCGK